MTTEKIIEDLEKMEGINFSHYSAPKLCTKNARERLTALQTIVLGQAQDIHDLQMQTSAQAAIIERLKKEAQK